MSTRINTNTTAFNAALNLSNNSDKLSKNIQRLSSGLRINSAADDAAGLVISESLLAQSGGLTQATNNTNDAINVVKTAEGALNEVQSLLINIRQTIIQAANVGSNNTTALQADKDSVAAAVASIDRITGTTQFNGKNLLDGSANSAGASFVAGTGTATSTAGSKYLSVTGQAAAYGGTAIASGNVVLHAGVADVEKAVFSAGTAADTFGGSFTIEGKAVALTGTANTITDIQTAIATQTGLSYTVTGTALTATGLTFTNNVTGAPAAVANFGALQSYTSGVSTASTVTSSHPTTGAAAYVTVNSLNSDTVSADGLTYSYSSGALKGLAIATNNTTAGTIGTFSATADTATPGHDLQFQIGANAGQTVSVSIGSQKSNNVGAYTNATTAVSYKLADLLTGGGLDLTDATGKAQQNALAVVDQAIADISTTREKLGSIQSNVLQSNLNTLGVAQQNTDASTSTIRDTNLSSEIVDYTKNQILVQAGTSALAYANQAPQAILKLLQ